MNSLLGKYHAACYVVHELEIAFSQVPMLIVIVFIVKREGEDKPLLSLDFLLHILLPWILTSFFLGSFVANMI